MIHLHVFKHDEEVPKDGWTIKRHGDNWLCVTYNGTFLFDCKPQSEFYLLSLMALAQKGERCKSKAIYSEEEAEAILFPNSSLVAQAIREVGNNICAEISTAVANLLTYSPRK